MPTPINTNLATILQAVESQLISKGGFTNATCFMSLNPDQSLMQPSDQYIIVTPGPLTVDQRIVTGGNLLYFTGSFFTTLWSRLALDQTTHDDSFLTDATYGALTTLNSVIGALHLFQPLDSSSNQELDVPIRLSGVENYSRDFKGVGWGAIKCKWLLEFQQAF